MATTPVPYFLWCGIGYREDVEFLIRALARVVIAGHRCQLRIISAVHYGWTPENLHCYAVEQGLPHDALAVLGRVDDQCLEDSYRSAAGLLVPLYNNEKSETRIPNKLAEYLAAGRPVVTSGVGDVGHLLSDGETAYLAKAGDVESFAGKMIAILDHPAEAAQIGSAGQRVCVSKLDYRVHSRGLAVFFSDCMDQYASRSF